MVTTRDCMSQLDHKLVDAQMAFVNNIEETKNNQ